MEKGMETYKVNFITYVEHVGGNMAQIILSEKRGFVVSEQENLKIVIFLVVSRVEATSISGSDSYNTRRKPPMKYFV